MHNISKTINSKNLSTYIRTNTFLIFKIRKTLPTFDDVLIVNASNDAAEDLDEYKDDACAESQNTVSGALTSCARHASASARVQHAS
jgi:hypothetical protein